MKRRPAIPPRFGRVCESLYNRAMPNYDRLSILVSLVVLGLALNLVIRLPFRVIESEFLGSPVTLVLSTQTLLALLLTILTAIGTEYILRAHPTFSTDTPTLVYSFPLWILPALVSLAGALYTPQLLQGGMGPWLLALGGIAAALSVVIVAQYRTISEDDTLYTPARLFLNIVTYLATLVLFTALYGAKLRSALSASVMIALATILALTLLRGDRSEANATWLYAFICGMILGEATWALNYWGVTGLAGGALLLLVFYFITGLAQQRLLNRFNRASLIEFGIVGLIGLVVLAARGALSW